MLIDEGISDIDDCNTDEYLEVEITNERVLSRYNARYYLDEETNCLKVLNSSKDKFLIGQTLKFRSPIKCKCSDGKVCKKCYGNLAFINRKIHVGIEAVLELTEQFTQKIN